MMTPQLGRELHLFLDYQLNHMYLRYLLWNFVGRESDEQDARWESGLEPTDGLRYLPRRASNKGKTIITTCRSYWDCWG